MKTIQLKDAATKLLQDIDDRVQKGGVPLVGMPTGFHKLDDALGGFRTKALYVLGGRTGQGKLLRIETPIITPQGWITMADLSVGDSVFDENGLPCRVTFTSPIETNATAYRVTFNDGEYIDACADHQWFTVTHADTKREHNRIRKRRSTPNPRKQYQRDLSHLKMPIGSIKTTQQIKDTLRIRKEQRINHYVPVAKAINLPDAVLPIAPYTFGAWLGDGTAKTSVITYIDEQITVEIQSDGYRVRQLSVPKAKSIEGFVTLTKQLGVYANKHIPMVYLRASYDQRLALLQGLMDTDGHVAKNGMCEITQKSHRLAQNIKELIHTLGMKATIRERQQSSQNGTVGTYYRVRFAPNVQVFRIPRKAEQCKTIRRKTTERRYIVSVEPIDPVPMRCISVDSPSNLYLAGSAMIPTHNTALAMTMAMNVAKTKRNVLFGSFEMSAELLVLRVLSGMTGIPAKNIERGLLTLDEFKRVQTAYSTLDEYAIHLYDNTCSSKEFAKLCADVQQSLGGLDLIVADYLSLMTDAGDSEVQRLEGIVGRVSAMTNQLDTTTLGVVQLNREVETQEGNRPTLRNIRYSDRIGHDAFGAFFVHRPYYYEMRTGALPLDKEEAEIILDKNRQGEIGTLSCFFYPKQMRWEDEKSIPTPPPSMQGGR